ncbi:Ig-like domain-containing protein [Enterobacter ludwigii]
MTRSNEQYFAPSPSILGSSTTSNGTELFTSKTQPRFNGSVPGEKSGIVVIWIDDVKYTAPIQPDGSYTFTPPVPLDEGLHNISIHAIKISGLIGEPALFTLHIDTTAPDAPLIEFVLDDAGSSTGARLSDEKTDDRHPVLRGNAEPGSIVKLYEGSTLLGSAQAGADGSWALEVSLSDGSHALTATSTDRLGNTSEKSAAFVLEIGDDSAAPEPLPGGAAQITHAVDNVGSNTGTVTSGGLTDDNTPELRGSAPAGSTVRIQYRNEAGAWTDGGNALLNGSDWSWTPPTLGSGQWEFRANAGSGWSDEFQLEIDFVQGGEATLTHAYDDFGANTGILSSGAISDDREPTLHGRGESNGVVYLHYRNTLGTWEVLDSVNVGADGRWTYDSPRLIPADYEFQASSTLTRDPQGESFALKIVSVGSYAPTIDYVWDDVGKTGQIVNNDKTNDSSPTLHGSAEANSMVTISYARDGYPSEGSHDVLTDSSGHWTWTPPLVLVDSNWKFIASYSLDSKLTSETFTLTIDTQPQSYNWDFNDKTFQSWTVAEAYLDGLYYELAAGGKGVLRATTPTSGKAYDGDVIYNTIEVEAGSTYKVNLVVYNYSGNSSTVLHPKLGFMMDGNLVIPATQLSSALGYTTLSGSYIATETKLIKISVINNESGYWGNDFSIDNISIKGEKTRTSNGFTPHANEMEVMTIDESHKLTLDSDSITIIKRNGLFIDNGNFQLMIKGGNGDTFEIINSASINTLKNGWTIQSGTITIAGIQYQVLKNGIRELLVQDGVNVVIPDTDATPVDEDVTTSPPEIASFGILGNTITSNGTELWTKNTQPTFNGSVPGEKSGIVVIWIDNDKYTAAIQPDGTYSFALTQPLDEGLHNISIHAIKLSGLIGEPTLFTLHVDTTAPDVPAIELALDDAGSNTGARLSGEKTDDRRPVLRGDAEPGSIVKIYEGSTLLGSVTAAANGVWQIEVSLSEGPHTLTATATDKLGNTSKQSASFVIEIGDDAMPLPGGSAHITHAVDNVGSYTGTLTNSGLTDDATPELHGSAPAGSTVRIQYRNGTGAWIDGGNALLNGSDWSWTPPALGEGWWEFRANAGGGWSDEFLLEIDLTPGSEASITHAYDDFGALTGLLTSGAITDDRTPTLYGRGESNSVVYLHYRNVLGDWEVLDSVNVGADGRWRYDTDRLVTGSYEFQVSSTLTRDPSAESFALKIVAAGSYVPTIEYAWDDFGEDHLKVLHNGITDDITPTLHGSAEANSVVQIEFWHSGEPVYTGYSVKTDSSGHWEWTPPTILTYDTWNFKAYHQAADPSANFTIEIAPPITAQSYAWDFNDNTLQGWVLGAAHGEIRPGGKGGAGDSYNAAYRLSRGYLEFVTPYTGIDYKSTVMHTMINVVEGHKYDISMNVNNAVSLGNKSGIDLAFILNGKVIELGNLDKTSSVLESWVADKTGLIKFEIFSNNSSWRYNDFAIDNIKVQHIGGGFTPSGSTKSQVAAEDAIDVVSDMNSHQQGVIDISATSEYKKALTLDNILEESQKSLFISNEHEQVLIAGDEHSVLSLHDLIADQDDISNWTEQAGLITIGGIEYNVIINDAKNIDILVQSDIKIEW